VGRVFPAAEAGFNHCEAALEEEDHKCADHDPGIVCPIQGLIRRRRDIGKRLIACKRRIGRAGRVGAFGKRRDGKQ